eukprot:768619-Hanusia_phi.AAC.1
MNREPGPALVLRLLTVPNFMSGLACLLEYSGGRLIIRVQPCTVTIRWCHSNLESGMCGTGGPATACGLPKFYGAAGWQWVAKLGISVRLLSRAAAAEIC